mmetsp:Transcript_66023/g.157557  ORF Transcript_66023/g.157557 Transcript_66023/m.157557 type:complete len:200 (+) Transcript_66023:469-1068(+)
MHEHEVLGLDRQALPVRLHCHLLEAVGEGQKRLGEEGERPASEVLAHRGEQPRVVLRREIRVRHVLVEREDAADVDGPESRDHCADCALQLVLRPRLQVPTLRVEGGELLAEGIEEGVRQPEAPQPVEQRLDDAEGAVEGAVEARRQQALHGHNNLLERRGGRRALGALLLSSGGERGDGGLDHRAAHTRVDQVREQVR